MAMARLGKRGDRPLDKEKLQELALHYVGRFATSRAKLLRYLNRKLDERGWAGPGDPPLEQLADRLVALGYVDDRSYALAKARSLTGRGYGGRRIDQALFQAGIDEADRAEAGQLSEREAVAAILRFARRRRLGPWASSIAGPAERERALAAMVRAGHSLSLARKLLALEPGEIPEEDHMINLD